MLYSVYVRYEVEAESEDEAAQKIIMDSPDDCYLEIEKVEVRC